jgi:hypothetical protein
LSVFACRLVIITARLFAFSVYFVMAHTSLSIDWTLVERERLMLEHSLSNGIGAGVRDSFY